MACVSAPRSWWNHLIAEKRELSILCEEGELGERGERGVSVYGAFAASLAKRVYRDELWLTSSIQMSDSVNFCST